MSEHKQSADTAASSPSQLEEMLPIERDASFVRLAADDIIVVQRSRDVQISLIAEGPDPKRQSPLSELTDSQNTQKVQVTQSFTELARISLAPQTAFSMAMNIVEKAILSRELDIPQFRVQLLKLLDQAETKLSPAEKRAQAKRRSK